MFINIICSVVEYIIYIYIYIYIYICGDTEYICGVVDIKITQFNIEISQHRYVARTHDGNVHVDCFYFTIF